MNSKQLIISIVISLLAVSCIGYRNASFFKAPRFDPNATFKVITLNSNDIIAGRIEHFLLINNFRVISDNSFRLPGNTAYPNPISPLDSTLYRSNPLVVNIPYMEEKPSDYIIRYQYDNPVIAQDKSRASLNIAVVNTASGETEVSFLAEKNGRFEQADLDRVIRDFIGRLRSR